MAQLNFRIGAKLGLTAAIGVVLVGGMLVNQLYGNQSIATTSGLVIANFSNKSNAQATDNGVMRAQLAIRDMVAARSAAAIDESLQAFRANVTDADAQTEAAAKRATRPHIIELYQGTKILLDGYLALGSELATAQKAFMTPCSQPDRPTTHGTRRSLRCSDRPPARTCRVVPASKPICAKPARRSTEPAPRHGVSL
jgi:methyl-accepting chemotaxis protein